MADKLIYELQDIKEDRKTNLLPENLRKGVTCLGIEGELEEGIDTSSNNAATASDIIEGKEAFVNKQKLLGTMDLANLIPENIKAGITINGIEGTYTGEASVE